MTNGLLRDEGRLSLSWNPIKNWNKSVSWWKEWTNLCLLQICGRNPFIPSPLHRPPCQGPDPALIPTQPSQTSLPCSQAPQPPPLLHQCAHTSCWRKGRGNVGAPVGSHSHSRIVKAILFFLQALILCITTWGTPTMLLSWVDIWNVIWDSAELQAKRKYTHLIFPCLGQ